MVCIEYRYTSLDKTDPKKICVRGLRWFFTPGFTITITITITITFTFLLRGVWCAILCHRAGKTPVMWSTHYDNDDGDGIWWFVRARDNSGVYIYIGLVWVFLSFSLIFFWFFLFGFFCLGFCFSIFLVCFYVLKSK